MGFALVVYTNLFYMVHNLMVPRELFTDLDADAFESPDVLTRTSLNSSIVQHDSHNHHGRHEYNAIASGVTLPRFESFKDLQAYPKWLQYLKSVYGKSVENASAYPLDLAKLVFFDGDRLKAADVLLPYETDKKYCPRDTDDLFEHMSGSFDERVGGMNFTSHDPPHALWLKQEGRFAGVHSHEWLEVTHCTSGNVQYLETAGYWMYYAKGSGIFFNVGKTIVFNDHKDAAEHFLGISLDLGCPPSRGSDCQISFRQYESMVELARKQGFHSIQFTWHRDQRCSSFVPLEIVALSNDGKAVCGPRFAGGLNAECACKCNPKHTSQCANCELQC